MTMSKIAALKAARNAVGSPIGAGTSWCFYAPYNSHELVGPSTEVRACSYSDVVQKRASRIAYIAFVQMTDFKDGEEKATDADYAIYSTPGNANEKLTAALRAAGL